MKKTITALALVFGASAALATGVQMKHTVTLKPGWNAFYLPITLTESASEVFENWPVDTVGFYDQAAFLATRQFKTDAADTTQGAIDAGMKMWKRGDMGHSSFNTLVANGVYVTVNTNRTTFSAILYGEPVAYRACWHVSDGVKHPVNYAGVSSSEEAMLAADGYLSGLASGWTRRWQVYGLPTSSVPGLSDISRNPRLKNGEVVAMDAEKVSDWSGVLKVSPAAGIVLGTNYCTSVVSIRNDAFEARRVRVSFRNGDGPAALDVPTIMYFDSNVHTNWQESLEAVPYERDLAAGDTLRLKVAVDREQELLGTLVGTEYGGIIDVEDVSSEHPSHFKTSIPFSVESDGGAFQLTKWPMGLWVANLALDKVSFFEESTSELKRVTRPMPVRLLLKVDQDGTMTLMERAELGGRRLSAPVLPTDFPEIKAEGGTFGGEAKFLWKVAEGSKVNPFRHAKHPDHDGLAADFKEKAPSGDKPRNYLRTVKPELFSITNELTLEWDPSTAATWSPEERLTGNTRWSLSGLRREGPIVMTGSFELKRISKE